MVVRGENRPVEVDLHIVHDEGDGIELLAGEGSKVQTLVVHARPSDALPNGPVLRG